MLSYACIGRRAFCSVGEVFFLMCGQKEKSRKYRMFAFFANICFQYQFIMAKMMTSNSLKTNPYNLVFVFTVQRYQ